MLVAARTGAVTTHVWSGGHDVLRDHPAELAALVAQLTAPRHPEEDRMTVNPFDGENGTFSVLVNDEGQYSRCPCFAAVPEGWTVVLAETDRAACLEHIESAWTDLRPRSLRDALAGDS